MMYVDRYPSFQFKHLMILSLVGLLANLAQTPVMAQSVVPDTTLGNEGTIVTPGAVVRGAPADLIEGGAIRGSNLFHSFFNFNVEPGERLYFANPGGIETIFSRVTGNTLSRIFGTLGVNGGADLFLLNPNGILFGPNARLDVSGSFLATTADRFTFGGNLEFSATNPQSAPLLTVNLRPGLQYGTGATATIANTGTLTTGRDLTLSAGNLNLQGQLQAGRTLILDAQNTLTIRDSATIPFLATSGETLTVQGNQFVDIFALNHPGSGLRSGGDLVLRSANPINIDAHFKGGGNFRAEGVNGSPVSLVSLVDPIFEFAGDVVLPAYTGGSLQIIAGGSVTLQGDITITGTSPAFVDSTVTLSNGSSLSISGTTVPILEVRAGQSAFFGIPTPGTATGADLRALGTLTIAPGGGIFLTNFDPANPTARGSILTSAINSPGGEVVFDSTDGITIAGNIDLSNVVGLGGDVTLLGGAGDITLNPGVEINSTGVLGGTLLLDTRGTISASNGGFSSFSIGPAAGQKGGDINIRAGSLVLNSAQIETSTIPLALLPGFFGSPQVTAEADAGNISITADVISLNNTSLVRGLIQSGATGKTAEVEIQTGSLFVSGGSQIGSGFFRAQTQTGTGVFFPGGQGTAGSIQITATDQIVLSGYNQFGFSSGIIAPTERGATGEASDITINIPTGLLQIENGAAIVVNTQSSGAGGDAIIFAETVELLSGGKILANTGEGGGQGGNVGIRANQITIDGVDPNFGDRLLLINNYTSNINPSDSQLDVLGGVIFSNSGIFANTDGRGAAGNIILLGGDVQVSNAGFISTDTDANGSAAAGNIFIGAETEPVNSLTMLSGGEIVSRTFGPGRGGDVRVNANSVLISGAAVFPFLPDGTNQAVGGFSSGIAVNAEDGSTGPGGFLFMNAGTLRIEDGGILSARTRGSGTGGDILVTVEDLSLIDGGQIIAPTFSSGVAGRILVTATGDVTISGFDPNYDARFDAVQQAWQQRIDAGTAPPGLTAFELTTFTIDPVNSSSGIQARVEPGAVANPANPGIGGNIFVFADGSLRMENGGLISTSTFGTGNAGTILLSVEGDVVMDDATIASAVRRGASGNGGDILISGNSFRMINGSTVSTGTASQGNGGSIFITAVNDVFMTNASTIRGTVEQFGIGAGGNVEVNARSLTLRNGAQIQASVFRAENGNPGGIAPRAGDLIINATDFVDIAGIDENSSGLLVSTEQGAQGPAGNIIVTTNSFLMGDRGLVNAETRNDSNAGNITINANRLFSSGGTIQSLSREVGSNVGIRGNAGNISLNIAGNITLQNGAFVSVNGESFGNPGNIGVNANFIFMSQGSSIDAESFSGNNANINLALRGGIFMRPGNNQISTLAFNNGDGGNITINAPLGVFSELSTNNDVVANALAGRGGNISVVTQTQVRQFRQFDRRIGRTPESDFIASSQLGVDGTVDIQEQQLQEAPPLPAALRDTSGLIAQACRPGRQGEFVITGRGGLPADPTQPLGTETVLTSWVEMEASESNGQNSDGNQSVEPQRKASIVEAQNWQIAPDGTVTLVAQDSGSPGLRVVAQVQSLCPVE